jgi:hypothetical protein
MREPKRQNARNIVSWSRSRSLPIRHKPTFGQIDRNDAERPLVLHGKQVTDNRVAISVPIF